MYLFQPNIYRKSIFEIDYSKLKEEGIRCLVFDLDNTLGLISNKECPKATKQLLQELKESFFVVVCSNNNRKRLRPYLEDLKIDGVAWSMKPSVLGLSIIRKKYKLTKEKMCIIGDQVVTDILAGNRFHIKTILVDPLGEKDLKITALNRILEKMILNHYQKKGLFERGKYYG